MMVLVVVFLSLNVRVRFASRSFRSSRHFPAELRIAPFTVIASTAIYKYFTSSSYKSPALGNTRLSRFWHKLGSVGSSLYIHTPIETSDPYPASNILP